MTRELLILRHGKSDWNAGADDFGRPLKNRGKRGAQRMGVWLLRHDMLPDTILSSPAERAIVTAEKACKAMGMGTTTIIPDKRIYANSVDNLLQVLHDCPAEARRAMLVGHNPGLEELLIHLVEQPIPLADDGKLLPTATLARLRLDCRWDEAGAGCARVEAIVRPDTLPKKFPFPGPDGNELRDRPAYYYTQSSVAPYRIRGNKMEILLISSSKRKHWVIPKGIKEPGLTPQASAAREALEEAGVEGEVGDEPIGSYAYEKWGAECSVDVYPMEVTRIIPEASWEERHRGREWVSVREAAERLKQIEVKSIVLNLPGHLGKTV
ncbi:MAG: histidine phosphatase family protein [Pseudomonadota bacterium]|nr:histidine phosphatase family protein [Pseudomonadota bacterium]